MIEIEYLTLSKECAKLKYIYLALVYINMLKQLQMSQSCMFSLRIVQSDLKVCLAIIGFDGILLGAVS